jgi:competence protein ComFC
VDIRGNSVLLRALFPRYCVKCDREGLLLCTECSENISLDGPPFAYANPVVRQLLCAWKYDGDPAGITALWNLTKPRLAALRSKIVGERIEAVVPVPLSAWKERWRGFHQTRDLAHLLGKEMHLPIVDCVQRRHRFSPQANLTKEIRSSAFVQSPFSIKKNAEIPKSVLLIDDVETTGATMNAVKEVLLAAGVEKVITWSLARG